MQRARGVAGGGPTIRPLPGAAGEQAVVVAEEGQRHRAGARRAARASGAVGRALGAVGDGRELAAAHGQHAGDRRAVDVGVAGPAGELARRSRRRRCGRSAPTIQVPVETTVRSRGRPPGSGRSWPTESWMPQSTACRPARPVRRGELGADRPEGLPGRRHRRHQPLPAAGARRCAAGRRSATTRDATARRGSSPRRRGTPERRQAQYCGASRYAARPGERLRPVPLQPEQLARRGAPRRA